MQFANLLIVWKDTFNDSRITALSPQTVQIVVDPGLTVGKNK